MQELSEEELASVQIEKIKEINSIDEINDDDYTDVGSEESDAESVVDIDESILERLAALVDIIPPVTRVKALQALEDVGAWTAGAFRFVGSGLWIISTASLLTLFPLALEMEREGAVIEQEVQQRNPGSHKESQKVLLYDHNLNRMRWLLINLVFIYVKYSENIILTENLRRRQQMNTIQNLFQSIKDVLIGSNPKAIDFVDKTPSESRYF